MIYVVTNQQELFNNNTEFQYLDMESAIKLIDSWTSIQYDCETDSTDCHLGKLLLAQFGSPDKSTQIVVDVQNCGYDFSIFKQVLENHLLVGHNLKFDLQWLYNYNIIPRKIWDTMIVEQLLFLGYTSAEKKYNLHDVAMERIGVDIDKTVRGQIIWRGVDKATIIYGATDVMHLTDIAKLQYQDCKARNCVLGAKIENDCVPAIAYLEWCGIKMSADKWKAKMKEDQTNVEKAKKTLDDWLLDYAEKHHFDGYNITPTTKDDLGREFPLNPIPFGIKLKSKFIPFLSKAVQLNLFEEVSTKPTVLINWDSPQQLVFIAKMLGFDTNVQDKETGEDKESAIEKQLTSQKGVNDKFLDMLFGYDTKDENGKKIHVWGYKEARKVVTTYGQKHLNIIHPITGRIHTTYRQIGTISGRMACGSNQPNMPIARYKKIPPKETMYPNHQQLPHDPITRACFVAEEGNLFCSSDFSAMEARIGADVYDEPIMLDEFLTGSGDSHAMYAKVVFFEELKDVPTKDVKKLRPDLRQRVKNIEFS